MGLRVIGAILLLVVVAIGFRQLSPLDLQASVAVFPQVLKSPVISGDQRAGGTVVCGRGAWDDSPSRRYPVTYAWRRDGQAIGGATGSRYLVSAADLGHELRCVVTAHSEDATADASASVYPYPRNRLGPGLQGSPTVGGTLTCGRGAWDERADSPYAITYQWVRNSSSIKAATGSAYTILRSDLGSSIWCVATAAGLVQVSSQSAYVAPVSLTDPGISGDPRVGGTLTCSRGTWDDPVGAPYAVSYRWYRDGAEVPSQTTASYGVKLADLGRSVRCRVIAEGLTTVDSPSISVYPTNRSAPVLSGDPRLGGTLTCSRGIWDERPGAAQFDTAYRWVRDGIPLSDETQPTYKVTVADLGRSLFCRVAVAGLNSADTVSVTPLPRSTLNPVLTGDPRLGGTLTCSRGTWDERGDTPYSVKYAWYRDGQALAATIPTRAVEPDDLGSTLSCSVTAQSLVTAYSSQASIGVNGLLAPGVSGSPYVGSTLTCSRGSWDERTGSAYAITYRWLRNGAPIEGATGPTYTATAEDANSNIQCETTAENYASQYSVFVFIRSGPPTQGGTPVNLGPPQITGEPRLKGTLTCSRGVWDDSPGAPYPVTIRWFREYPYNDPQPTPIDQTADHTVVQADLGNTLWCVARTGGVEALTQIGVNPPNSLSSPQISGDPRIGHTLTCSRGGWDDPATPYDVTYAWFRAYPYSQPPPDMVDTGTTHVVSADDVTSQQLYCLVTAAAARTALATQPISPPLAVIAPRIDGDERVGSDLTCTRGTWDDETGNPYPVAYAWYRQYPFGDPAPDPVDTGAVHTVTTGDLGSNLYCVVTAATVGNALAERYVPPPRLIRAPLVSGTPRVGGQLHCDRGVWDDPEGSPYPVTLAWYRDYPWSDPPPPTIDTGASHTVVSADLGHDLTCVATAPGAALASASQHVAGPIAVAPPEFDHEPRPGIATTCSRGTWDDPSGAPYPVTYAWYRDGIDDESRVSATASYTPTASDVGHQLLCVVSAANLTDSIQSTYIRPPELRSSPTILGDTHIGGRLVCTRGDWDDEEGARYPVTFEWYRDFHNGEPVSDDNRIGSTDHHTVTGDDLGATLGCVVSAMGLSKAEATTTAEDVQPTLTTAVDDDQPAPGGTVTVDLVLFNGGVTALHVSALRDRPFPGATYLAGSSSGATTAEPLNNGDLEWQLDTDVAPGGTLVEHYRVALPPGTADLVDRPDVDASREATVPQRARVSPQSEPASGECTILGTAGADVLSGTPGSDVICGLGGDDVLAGLGGDDRLWGGDGGDRLEGGEGNDALHGGHGEDELIGAAGADLIGGGGGASDLVSYADRDTAVTVSLGSGGNDDGAVGEHDTVSRDVERVRGGSAGDTLIGSDDPNQLDGRGGDDLLTGLGGIDDLIGGPAADDIDSVDANQELVDCGGGDDVVARDATDRVVGCERAR
jgi:Ca2+-binding RTX toxin-like protein